MRCLLLLAALLLPGPAPAQATFEAEDDCARLAEAVAGGMLPVLWEDEAEEMVEIAEAGSSPACLAAFDLIRPSPPTGPADLPPSCLRLREVLAEDGLPAESESGLDALVISIGEGDAEGCAAGLEELGIEG